MPPPELLGCGSPTLAGTISGNITALWLVYALGVIVYVTTK